MFNSKEKVWRKKHEESVEAAHLRSKHSDKSFDWFFTQVWGLVQGIESGVDFDDAFYLKNNSDVEKAVAEDIFCCGYVHFCIHGQDEFRPWSTKYISRKFGIKPILPDGLTKPVLGHPLPKYVPNLSKLPDGDVRSLVILIPHLVEKLFFAGYTGFFKDLSTIFDDFDEITVVVTNPNPVPQLVKNFCERINVIELPDVSNLSTMPDLIYCFDTETFFQAKDIFNVLDRTVYYCQDFESGFHPFGSMHIRGERAVALSRNLVFSTGLLEKFMSNRGLISTNNVFVTAPQIEPVDVVLDKRKKLFFYYRPERFNSRNMAEDVMSAVDEFCRRHQGYEIYLVGSVDVNYSQQLHGMHVSIVSKLPKEDYLELLKTCDVVVALIYSAHPGVIAFQAAASGIPTVTNTFENRNADDLKAISDNIVPFDPIRENLCERVEVALQMAKGKKSFREELYSGIENRTFAEFNNALRQEKSVKCSGD